MKRAVLVLALLVLAAVSVFAIPMVYRTYEDGWMMGGIGLSVSVPDFKLSPVFEFEVGGPQQFGLSVTFMFGGRTLATLGAIYLLDPAPGSIFAIPIIARVGLINGSFSNGGSLQLGMSLSSGIRAYPISFGDSPESAMDLTADVEGSIYWNFGSEITFSVDAYPGIIFTLVDTGYYYVPYYY